MILLKKDISDTNIFDILDHVNSINGKIYNDVIKFLNNDLCFCYDGEINDFLDYDFKDTCYSNDITTIEDLLYTDKGDQILHDFLSVESIKNMTGILELKENEDLMVYLDISEIKELSEENEPEEKIGNYLENVFYKTFHYICSYGGKLHDRINEFCYDDYQITDIIKYIKSGELNNTRDLANYIIRFFR
jgi:hypothetical protein